MKSESAAQKVKVQKAQKVPQKVRKYRTPTNFNRDINNDFR